MTRYEELKNKAELCRLTASKTEGRMRLIWLQKAMDLEILAGNLPMTRASQNVGK